MEIDTDNLFENAVRDAIRKGVEDKFKGYNSPLDKILAASVATHKASIRGLLEESIQSCITDPSFREDIAQATRNGLAKILVKRFGGELEKQVNTLKSDPTTRARITLAIEDIVKSSAS